MFFKKDRQPSIDFIVVGLGNPGPKYEYTRHNAGFLSLDLLSSAHGIRVDTLKFKALCGRGHIAGKKVLLMRPQTYMNLSGEAAVAAAGFYGVPLSNLLVISDDAALPMGRIRIREKGSAGGQNGLKDIIKRVGSEEFPRVRVGIGAAPEGWDLADWVLAKLTQKELAFMRKCCAAAAEAAEAVIRSGAAAAGAEFNGRVIEP